MNGDLFDSSAEFLIEKGSRPHWSQDNAIVFITFRTRDAIPESVLKQWNEEKTDWLKNHGLDITGVDFSTLVAKLPFEKRSEYRKRFNRQREDYLDQGMGECILRQKSNATIVADSLMHFDGDRYSMGDFVIMPNHVHLLAAFPDSESMRKQISSWLHFTSTQINKSLGKSGRFWQQEPFDHLVRSVEQLAYLKRYIEQNPMKAGLNAGEFLYRRFQA